MRSWNWKNKRWQLLFYFPTIDNIQKHLKSEINDFRSKINFLQNDNQIERIIRNLQQLHSETDNELKDRADYYIDKFDKKLNAIGTSKIYRNDFLQRENIRLKKPAQTQGQKKKLKNKKKIKNIWKI